MGTPDGKDIELDEPLSLEAIDAIAKKAGKENMDGLNQVVASISQELQSYPMERIAFLVPKISRPASIDFWEMMQVFISMLMSDSWFGNEGLIIAFEAQGGPMIGFGRKFDESDYKSARFQKHLRSSAPLRIYTPSEYLALVISESPNTNHDDN